ncbi:type II toxin-antitoxin system VapC family toxin [Verticiella alkaliphila]|uniref:type II toxin-antitoxin system VapC family toxin n=1 Tax=Verticiella alkaliphila TaxID=2779529 RepID=UPI001C0D0FD5|nr:type II toxin-antitoxin system VapC family toxin [Verticiella sp. GG226]
MFVLDNCVTMCWVLNDGNDGNRGYAERVLRRLMTGEAVVPSIWGLEVGNVLAKSEARGLITEARSQGFLSKLERLSISSDSESQDRAFSDILNLARRYKLSTYDASYLELAIRRQIPLATVDKDLVKAARLAGVYLEV